MESCHIWYIQKVEIRGLEGKVMTCFIDVLVLMYEFLLWK